MKKTIRIFVSLFIFILLAGVVFAALLFTPKTLPYNYKAVIKKGQGWQSVANNLKQDNAIYSALVLRATLLFVDNKPLKHGAYTLKSPISTWQLINDLPNAQPNVITLRIAEGATFNDIKKQINSSGNIKHTVNSLSEKELLQKIDPNSEAINLEGLLFPDTYVILDEETDIEIYRTAYKNMQKKLQTVWEERNKDLPYKNPYELLIMASIIERETSSEKDRGKISAVFVNRLNLGMRLQTDPTVIYGMGSLYKGKIRKEDLQTDTPYNTYTRNGLPPTPISFPSLAALKAAANPDDVPYLYFVSKMDNTGESQFSITLDEHNAAVRKYILKQ